MKRTKHLRAVDAPPDPTAPETTDVPPPPKSLTTIEREVWIELAPQVSARKIYDATMYTAFRLLVMQVADAFNLTEDAPDTARARAFQSAQAAMGRWGLTPKDRKHASKAEVAEKGGKRTRWRRQ